MNRHHFQTFLFTSIIAVLVLSACAAPQAQPTPALLSPTPLPPTKTSPLSTDTPLPPSVTPVTPTLPQPSATTEPSFSILEGKKRIGDAKIHYICYGEGSPTVVLESGFGVG